MFKINKNQLKKEYLIRKSTDYEIAKNFNCSPTWISTLRKKYDIKSIKPYERNKAQILSQKQEELIYGSLLGDATIKFGGRKGNKNAFFQVSQTSNTLIELKHLILSNFVKTKIKIYRDKRQNRRKIFYFSTISHPIFTKIYDDLYPSKIKTISKGWLEKLTPFSLAIWYMDDGSIVKSTHQMRISTESFSYNEHLLLKEYLKNCWNIEADIKNLPISNKFILSFKAKERDKFFKLISPFIIPEMQYKICKDLKEWKGWTSFEREYLKNNYIGSRIGWKKLLHVLNHSKQAIERKASYLGLTRRVKI